MSAADTEPTQTPSAAADERAKCAEIAKNPAKMDYLIRWGLENNYQVIGTSIPEGLLNVHTPILLKAGEWDHDDTAGHAALRVFICGALTTAATTVDARRLVLALLMAGCRFTPYLYQWDEIGAADLLEEFAAQKLGEFDGQNLDAAADSSDVPATAPKTATNAECDAELDKIMAELNTPGAAPTSDDGVAGTKSAGWCAIC